MIRLVIEDIDADVLQTETIVGEYAIAPIGDISKRVGARSTNFKLPKTANNKSIFESGEIPTSASDKPYKRLKARLYVDGVDIDMQFCTLESVDDYYNVRLYGGNGDLFAVLKEKKLADLDLREYNHHWDVSFLPTTEAFDYPIQYAIIDYNEDSPNSAIDTSTDSIYMGCLLPVVRENFLVEKVINEAGYTLDNKVLDETVMKERSPVIPMGTKELERFHDVKRYEGNFYFQPIPIGSMGGLSYGVDQIVSQKEKYWQPAFGQNANDGGSFVIPDSMKFKFKLDVDVYNDDIVSNTIHIDLYATTTTGAPAFTLFQTYTEVIPSAPISLGVKYNFQIEDGLSIYVQNNGIAQFYFIVRSQTSSQVFNLAISDNRFSIFDIDFLYDINGDKILAENEVLYQIAEPQTVNYLTIANNLPDFTQSDFLKEYLKKYGSVLQVNERSKVVTIIPFKRLRDNIFNAYDWSGKVDYSERPKTTFDIGYSQNNVFKYKDDDSVIKPINTDYTLVIDDDSLTETKTVIELKYLATEQVERLAGRTIPQIKVFDNYLFNKGSKPRCLYLAFGSGSFQYRKNLVNTTGAYTMTGTNIIPYAYFILEAFPHGLGFGNDLFDSFYSYLNLIVAKSKKLELPIRLNTLDIATFDFTRPIYINELDGYFYVNKIKFNFTNKESSIVELIKLF